jgi:hypothetical protein
MPEPTVTIRGNRVRLVLQALVMLAAGIGAGWFLQDWDPISRSLIGRVDALVPVPLVLVAVAGVAVAIAFALIKESWTHVVELRAQEVCIRTGQGTLTVPYSAIAMVKILPAYGVGIALREPDGWLERIAGTPGAPPAQRQISEMLRKAWGVDIGIVQKNLDVTAETFVEMLERRARPPD